MTLGLLILWEIKEDYPTLSDYRLILLRQEDIVNKPSQLSNSKPTGWNIQGFIKDEYQFNTANNVWIA